MNGVPVMVRPHAVIRDSVIKIYKLHVSVSSPTCTLLLIYWTTHVRRPGSRPFETLHCTPHSGTPARVLRGWPHACGHVARKVYCQLACLCSRAQMFIWSVRITTCTGVGFHVHIGFENALVASIVLHVGIAVKHVGVYDSVIDTGIRIRRLCGGGGVTALTAPSARFLANSRLSPQPSHYTQQQRHHDRPIRILRQ